MIFKAVKTQYLDNIQKQYTSLSNIQLADPNSEKNTFKY